MIPVRTTVISRRGDAALYDDGLRAYMLRVYNLMGLGLAVTGLVAYAVANTPALFNLIFGTPLMWVVMLAPIGLAFFLGARVQRMSQGTAQVTFWIFAALMGASLATVFAVFTGASIARVFFITAAAFGGLSLYGYTTKKSLSGWGSFLLIGLIGIIVASVVNLFIGSSALQFAVSVIGVIVFAGLTAYDTQMLRNLALSGIQGEQAERAAINGALALYLDFINMFLFILRLFGIGGGSRD